MSEDTSLYEVEERIHPWAIVMSQDCDLDQDCKAAEKCAIHGTTLPNILFCEIKTARSEMDDFKKSDAKGEASQAWKRIIRNTESRFHFLQRAEATLDSAQEGLEEFVIDFKRYFTMPPTEVYRQLNQGIARKRCVLVSPYLEHLANRYHTFQSRVALDADHFSD